MGSRRGRRQRLGTDDEWRPRPHRLLIGLGLIAIAIVWLVLDSTIWATKESSTSQTPSTPGVVATGNEVVGGVKVRPILVTTDPSARAIAVRVSFDNGAAPPRLILPRDLHLLDHGRSFNAITSGADALRATRLREGQFVTGVVRFAHALTPGITLTYGPSWGGGHTVHWVLWQ